MSRDYYISDGLRIGLIILLVSGCLGYLAGMLGGYKAGESRRTIEICSKFCGEHWTYHEGDCVCLEPVQ